MAARSFGNPQLASPDAVKRAMNRPKGSPVGFAAEPPTGGKGAVKPGGAPLDEGIHVAPDNPLYRAQGKRGFTEKAVSGSLSPKKRKTLKDITANAGADGLKKAAARRLGKMGASKFSGRAL